jgi:hypothetical protein
MAARSLPAPQYALMMYGLQFIVVFLFRYVVVRLTRMAGGLRAPEGWTRATLCPKGHWSSTYGGSPLTKKVMLLTSITDDMVYAQAMMCRIGTYNTGTTLVRSPALCRLQACCSD